MARPTKTHQNSSRAFNTQQSLNSAVKSICDIMRRSNCAGALQYVPELTWILFLRILDEREIHEAETAEAVGAEYQPSLEPLTAGRIGPPRMVRNGRNLRTGRLGHSRDLSTPT
jgi:type I restriction enzyme M protein